MTRGSEIESLYFMTLLFAVFGKHASLIMQLTASILVVSLAEKMNELSSFNSYYKNTKIKSYLLGKPTLKRRD
jgi:hypothetical protein